LRRISPGDGRDGRDGFRDSACDDISLGIADAAYWHRLQHRDAKRSIPMPSTHPRRGLRDS